MTTTTPGEPPVRHPFLNGVAYGAAATTTAVVFAVFSMSFAVFAVTLALTGIAVLTTRPVTLARTGGLITGAAVALFAAFSALAAFLSHAGL
jgi:hypothetical protein